MKKITVMALHLGYGGIEKAISDLCNSLSDKYNIEIVSTYKLFDEPINHLNDSINVKYLIPNLKPNKQRIIECIKKVKLISLFKEGFKAIKILYLRKRKMINYIKNCNSDIIISTRIFHNNILSKYASNTCTRIAWEHNYHNNNKTYIKKLISSVKKLDYFVVVSKTLYNDYENLLAESNCKCVFIPNMINKNTQELSKVDNYNLVSVSRLSSEKGLYDLIDVVGLVKDSIKQVKLNIIGDGVLFKDLDCYIKNKNLSQNIKLLGYKKTDDVYKYLSKSSLYVMTSFTESFGIVILESFSCGVPVIAFDSAIGACELINENNGYLISNRNKEKMAETIVNYFNDDKLRVKLSKGTQKELNYYLSHNVCKLWEKIL